MSELEDLKLKSLLNELKLEKPNSNFSVRVMNRIFEENIVLEKIKSERILGTGFWIISILFVALLIAIVVVSNTGVQPESQISQLIPDLNSGIGNSYQSVFNKIGTLPLSIAGILLATSILLFIERFISSNAKIFTINNH